MTDSDKDDLGRKVAHLLEQARGSGLRPDGSDDKAFMDEMWGEGEPNHLAAVVRAAEAILHDAYLDACKRAGRALNPADLGLPPWTELVLAEAFEQVELEE